MAGVNCEQAARRVRAGRIAVVLLALAWIALAGSSIPGATGFTQAAAVVAAAVLIAAFTARLVVLVQYRAGRTPVRAAVRRTPAPQRLWDADAPGHPRPRAPGDGCFRDPS